MTIKTDKQEKYTILSLETDKLVSTNAPDLKAEFVKLNAEGVKNMIIDLEKVGYCDSSGLSAILVGSRLCRNNNGSFVLASLQSPLVKMIEISKLDTILTSTPQLKEAIDLVFMEEIERDLMAD